MTTNNILLLPVDILVNIFKKLNLSDLRNLMLTCKTLNNIVKTDNSIWRSQSSDLFVIQNGAHRSKASELSWYHRCRISHNWCYGYYKTKVIVHHYVNYMPWLQFPNSESLLVSVGSELHCYSTDKRGLPTARIAWKIDVPKIKRHDVRTNDISRFVIKNNHIVCGNRDGCVAIYYCDNIHKRPWLQCQIRDCHRNGEAEVTAVETINDREQLVVITGSNNSCDLKFCAIRPDDGIPTTNDEKSIDQVFMYKDAGTKCLSLNSTNNILAVGLNGNSRPVIMDVNNAKFLMTADATRNPKHAIKDIGWHNENTIVYVTHSGYLELLDKRSHEVVFSTMDPFQSSLYCVKSDGRYAIVVGSAEYSRCVLFDSRNVQHHVQMYFTQRKTSPVYGLDFDSTKLITAVDRGVAVLNFNIDSSTEQQKDYSHVFY